MTIEQSKEKLKKEGYTWFELSDYDIDFYNWLLRFKCNETNNLKDSFKSLRSDYHDKLNSKIQYRNDFETYVEANKKKNEIYNEFSKNGDIFQLWYYAELGQLMVKDGEIDIFTEYVKNIMINFFNFEETQEYSLFASNFTYYDLNCSLQNHSDGTGTGRVCAVLIYLNENYDEKDGGCLVLNNNEVVVPTFGKVAIIDLQTFDIKHKVTKVTGGIGRYALLTFVKLKENEFIDY